MLKKFLLENNIEAYYLPKSDRFQSEYLQASEERLQWLTGFTGSAGKLLITPQQTALFTDNRYAVQAKQEVSKDIAVYIDESPLKWLQKQAITTLTVDPWLVTDEQLAPFVKENIAINYHSLDVLWENRPAPFYGEIFIHPLEFSGKPWQEKITDLRENHASILISDPASLCWLLNIRGNDLEYTPLVLGFGLVTADNITVYSNHEIPQTVKNHFGKAVGWKPEAELLKDLPENIVLDKDTCPVAISQKYGKSQLIENPLLLPKAIKNNVEQQGIRLAHQRDGRILSQFLTHISNYIGKPEHQVSALLDAGRAQQPNYHSLSFPTIAGSGANGAIVHYRATPKNSRKLQKNELFLVDSGAQYYDGTTDVTRTVLLGDKASNWQKECFTRVLKGHIAMAVAIFPKGTTGAQLDVLARQYLWQAGLDYGHGTGHGVGSFLGVHEGPQGISKRALTPLQAGMILSNEPGYYEEGAFGIRIENLVLVQEHKKEGFLHFETLTLAPLDERLIDEKLLNDAEQQWFADYQQKAYENMANET